MTFIGGILENYRLVRTIVQEIDPSCFHVEVLDEVFSCFMTSLGKTPSYRGI